MKSRHDVEAGKLRNGMVSSSLQAEEDDYQPRQAKYIALRGDCRILTVIAASRQEAAAEIVRQLSKPGRRDILDAWERHGRRMTVEYL